MIDLTRCTSVMSALFAYDPHGDLSAALTHHSGIAGGRAGVGTWAVSRASELHSWHRQWAVAPLRVQAGSPNKPTHKQQHQHQQQTRARTA
jgi:hypothetical protein